MNTPKIVVSAFSPDSTATLTLEAVLVLESIGCRYLTGGTPGLRDAILTHLAMVDLPALKKARAANTVDKLVEAWARDRRPADLVAMQPEIAQAIERAFSPAPPTGGDDGADDPLAKKNA